MSAVIYKPTEPIVPLSSRVVIVGYVLKCMDHPTYKAIRRPTANCESCRTIFALAHPEKTK